MIRRREQRVGPTSREPLANVQRIPIPAFLSPAAISATSPHQSTSRGGLSEANHAWRFALHACRHDTARLSQLWVHGDDHEGRDASRRQLLALHGMRRYLECVSSGGAPVRETPMEMTSTRVVRQLRELITALDRRVPQVLRAGEASISRDAATLRTRALKHIEELECEAARVEKACSPTPGFEPPGRA
jgi:hypothetical protein